MASSRSQMIAVAYLSDILHEYLHIVICQQSGAWFKLIIARRTHIDPPRIQQSRSKGLADDTTPDILGRASRWPIRWIYPSLPASTALSPSSHTEPLMHMHNADATPPRARSDFRPLSEGSHIRISLGEMMGHVKPSYIDETVTHAETGAIRAQHRLYAFPLLLKVLHLNTRG